MLLHNAIGIDPDSMACVASLVTREGSKPLTKRFLLTAKGRNNLAQFIATVPGCLVGIEGRRGQSSPLESFFHASGIPFYCIPALKIGNYRKAMVGVNKNNENDARAVAEFLLDVEAKGQLEAYREEETVDQELRILARQRLDMSMQITQHVNQLWKFLKLKANDLYLALKGNDDNETTKTKLNSTRILLLISTVPELSSWVNLSEQDILEHSGGKKVRGWENLIQIIRSSSRYIDPVSFGAQLILRHTAETLIRLQEQESELDHQLKVEVKKRPLATALVDRYKGMGIFTAALMLEEIITIRRFANDDKLASYAGLTKRDHSTGTNTHQVQPGSCNTRLKSAFINLAKGYLLNNKGTHLEKYHQYLLKRGMSRMEALKRIARALAREVYRFLKLTEKQVEIKKGETVALDSASGFSPRTTSNTSPPLDSLTPKESGYKQGGFT